MTQQAGQDVRAFLEQFKCAASEVDIEGMSQEDALCLTLLSGVRDARLLIHLLFPPLVYLLMHICTPRLQPAKLLLPTVQKEKISSKRKIQPRR